MDDEEETMERARELDGLTCKPQPSQHRATMDQSMSPTTCWQTSPEELPHLRQINILQSDHLF